MNIKEYFETIMQTYKDENKFEMPDRWDELGEEVEGKPNWPVDCVCGVASARLIDRCQSLLSLMNETNKQQAVVTAVCEEILIICYG